MTGLPDPDASYALLIGVHDYEHLADLPAVSRNLTGLAQAFTDLALWGLPETHCVALSQPRNAQEVLDTLSGLAQRATDSLVVYYAGHGLTDPHSDELYLALPGSDHERLYSALPYEWVRRAILDPRVVARHKVVILDCCYSGRALLGGMSATGQVADQALIDGTSLMAASAETRRALSPPGEEFTAFTGELIVTLTDGITGGPPLLDMHTLYRHLHVQLAAKSRPLPQQRNRNTGGHIALARNRAHLPALPPEPVQSPPPPKPSRSPQSSEAIPSTPPPRRSAVTAPPPPPSVRPPDTETPGDAWPPDAPAPNPVAAADDPRDRIRRTGRWGPARTRIVAATVAAVLVTGGVTASIMLLNGPPDGSHGDAEKPAGKDSGAPTTATKAAFNIALQRILKPSTVSGGTLKFVADNDVDSWDPQRIYSGQVGNFSRYYTRQLVTYATKPGAEGAELMPDLAASRAEITNHGKTYTYTLRKGITWQDGTPVTSADIKYGIERLWAQDVLPGGLTYLRDALDPHGKYRGPYDDTSKRGLAAIVTPDEHTIVFQLPKARNDFEQLLAMPTASPVPQSHDTKEKYGNAPFSNGPYVFKSYKPGLSLVLERNQSWKASSDPVRKALPDEIRVTIVGPGEVDSKLFHGDYDLALDPGLSDAARALVGSSPERAKNMDNPQTSGTNYVAFPQGVKPMNNIHCRKAVVFAADHASLQAAFGGPTGGALAPSLLPPGIKGADPTYDPYGVLKGSGRPNVAKAKDELKRCGEPNGFTTTIVARGDRSTEQGVAEVLASSLKKVGIAVRIEQSDPSNFIGTIGSPAEVKKKGYGIVPGSWVADYPNGQGFLQPLVDGRAIRQSENNNIAEINSSDINKLLDEAAATTSPDEAADLSQKINHKVSEGAYYLPIIHRKYLSWRGPRLTNVYVSGAYGSYDYVSLGVRGT